MNTPSYIDIANHINRLEIGTAFGMSQGGAVQALIEIDVPQVNITADRDVLEIERSGWAALSGFSNQEGYSGPIIHPSEFFSGPMARQLHFKTISKKSDRVYALVEVTDPDDPDALVGWAVLERTA